MRVLLQHGDTASSAGKDIYAALMLSARNGHLIIVGEFMRVSAELEVRGKKNDCTPPAHHGCDQRAPFNCKISGRDRCQSRNLYLSNGEGPMYTAAFLGNVDVVKLLLSLGVDPGRAVVCHSAHGETRVALDAAAEFGHWETSSAQFRFASCLSSWRILEIFVDSARCWI